MAPRHPVSTAKGPTLGQMIARSHGGHQRVLGAIAKHQQLQLVTRADLTSLATLRRWGAVSADGNATDLGLTLLSAMRERNGQCRMCGRGLLGSIERQAGACVDCQAARP